MADLPLAGMRVFVTRPRHQAEELSRLLRELGAEPLVIPAIRVGAPDDLQPLHDAVERLRGGRYAWLIVTSRNAVDVLSEHLEGEGDDVPKVLGDVRVAAVGPATARRLRRLGVEPALVPETFTARALAEAVPDPPASGPPDTRRVLVLRPEGAAGEMSRVLAERGWRCDVAAAYRTVPDETSREDGRRALAAGVDAILFTSGSTVRSFLELWGEPPAEALVCCIGDVTAAVAHDEGVRVDVVAGEHTAEGLVAALAQAVRR